MKNYILAGVSAIGGAIAGSLVTYVVCSKQKKKELDEKQKIVDEIVAENRKKKAAKEEPAEEESSEDHSSVPEREEASIDISKMSRQTFTDYHKVSNGGNMELKDDLGPITDDPPRIQILKERPDMPDEDITCFDLYQNGVLTQYLTGEVIDPDQSEHYIGYKDPGELMKLRKGEIYIYNSELEQYFVVCVNYEDYEEE